MGVELQPSPLANSPRPQVDASGAKRALLLSHLARIKQTGNQLPVDGPFNIHFLSIYVNMNTNQFSTLANGSARVDTRQLQRPKNKRPLGI